MDIKTKYGFTLIEMLVVIAVIAALAVIVVIVINPAELLKRSRDTARLSDLSTLQDAIGVYEAGVGSVTGSSSVIYVSLPDPAAAISGNQCSSLSLPTLPAGWAYHCAASSSFRNIDGTGWLPVDFTRIPSGAPISHLPVDDLNASGTGLYYAYTANGAGIYNIASIAESSKYKDSIANGLGNGIDIAANGNTPSEPVLWYKFDENPCNGTAYVTTAQDSSGNGLTGNWSGGGTGPQCQRGFGSANYAAGGIEGNAAAPTGGTALACGSNIPQLKFAASSSFSVSVWVNPTPPFGADSPVFQYSEDALPGYLVGIRQTQLPYFASGLFSTSINGPAAIPGGAWSLVTAVQKGSQDQELYVNGQFVASSTIPNNANGGGSCAVGSSGYAGGIDDLRVYNYALNPAQIQEIYYSQY